MGTETVRLRITDQSENGNDAEESESKKDGEEEFELEGRMTREQGANVLRPLANGVATGSVDLCRDEGPLTVPERFEVEVKYEAVEEETELEVELGSSMIDGQAVSTEEDGSDGNEETAASEEGADDQE